MASLPDLSTELLDTILDHLLPSELVKVAQSCKTLHHHALIPLYRSISWTWSGKLRAEENPPVHLLLRSILANSDLASRIEHLSFQATDYRVIHQRPFDPGSGPRLSPLELKSAEVIYRDFPNAEEWRDGLADGHIGASIALLLSQLRNLRSLALGPDLQKHNKFLGVVLDHVIIKKKAVCGFECLEHVDLGARIEDNDHRHYSIPLSLDQFLPFFYVPTLHSAAMLLPDVFDRPNRQTYPGQRQVPWPLSAPSAPALASLHLKRSRASPEMLKGLTAATPNLKTLEYDYWCRSHDSLDTKLLREALDNVAKTLEHLVVGFTPYSGEAEDIMEQGENVIQGALGPLKHLVRLQTLEISLTVLLGWHVQSSRELADTLPPGLQSATIRDDAWGFEDWEWWDEESMDKFSAFLNGKWREATPRLSSFNLRLLHAFLDDWEEPLRRKLIADCEAQGLKCQVVKLGRDP